MPTLTDLAQRLNCRSAPSAVPRLFFMTDKDRVPDPVAAAKGLPCGTAIVLRHTDKNAQRKLANDLKPIVRGKRLKLLIAGDIRLARQTGADGVHLSDAQARRIPGKLRKPFKGFLLTTACHSPRALARAEKIGADCAFLSPVFATKSHPNAKTVGPLRFGLWSERANLPVIALGGIDSRTAKRLMGSAIHGFAAIGALLK